MLHLGDDDKPYAEPGSRIDLPSMEGREMNQAFSEGVFKGLGKGRGLSHLRDFFADTLRVIRVVRL